VRKSLLYLLSVQKIHAAASQTKDTTLTSNKAFIRELDSIYTHNLFYLAQAYGELFMNIEEVLICHFVIDFNTVRVRFIKVL
jgi:2-oxo-4-hydroxy-4-carboxy--5-ureidoimidazoline (OHCU) decarboxylase